MSTAWNNNDGDKAEGRAVDVTPSSTPTFHDVRDGSGRPLGVLSHPAPRAPWWFYARDKDLDAALTESGIATNPYGAGRFTSRKAVVEWIRQHRASSAR